MRGHSLITWKRRVGWGSREKGLIHSMKNLEEIQKLNHDIETRDTKVQIGKEYKRKKEKTSPNK